MTEEAIEQLVQAVMDAVLARMGQTGGETVVIGPNTTPWPSYQPGMEAAQWQQVLLTELPPWRLAALAQGIGRDEAERFILDALLLGKRVTVLASGLGYRACKDTAAKGLYHCFLDWEQQLCRWGMEIQQDSPVKPVMADQDRAALRCRLLDAAQVQALAEQGQRQVVLAGGTVVTPLARDMLRELAITVRYGS